MILRFWGFAGVSQTVPAKAGEGQLGGVNAAAQALGEAGAIRLLHLEKILYRAAAGTDEMDMGLCGAIKPFNPVYRSHTGNDPLTFEQGKIPVDRRQGNVRLLLLEQLVQSLGAGVGVGSAEAGQDGVAFAKLLCRFHCTPPWWFLFAIDYHLRWYHTTDNSLCQ